MEQVGRAKPDLSFARFAGFHIFFRLNPEITRFEVACRLQKKFKQAALNITIEQWSILYQLWKQEGLDQHGFCCATFRDKPSITPLADNLEKLQLVKSRFSG